jgi:putative hydrolase of the HAD superfamily
LIKAIIFDFFGVLTTDGIRELKDSHPDPLIRQEITEITKANDLGQLSDEAFSVRLAEVVGETEAQLYRRFYSAAKLDQGLLTLIDQLHKTYKTGLLSNASQSSIDTYWTRNEMTGHFDEVVLSAEVHMVKPDPAIYQLALDRLGVEPHEAVFIDDAQYSVKGAQELGLSGIVFTDTAQLKAELAKLDLLRAHHVL